MVTVRGYRVEDEDAVVRMWWNSWHSIRPGLRHPQSFAAWRTRWASDIAFKQEVVVADDEGTIVGFAAAEVSARELTQIFIDPSRKGEGIGGQLLAWAKQLMPDGFSLHTLTDNRTSPGLLRAPRHEPRWYSDQLRQRYGNDRVPVGDRCPLTTCGTGPLARIRSPRPVSLSVGHVVAT